MASFCIKTNNNKILNYIVEELNKFKKENFKISKHSFKIYNNIIIHCNNSNVESFYNIISSILSNTIMEFYEPISIKKEIEKNYFYFSEEEKNRILELYSNEILSLSNLAIDRFNILYSCFYLYIKENHSLILDGFYNFRLSNYHKIVSEILDICVNNFLMEREYFEFINILKLYVSLNASKISLIHLVFFNEKFVILDSRKNIINYETANTLNAKFLSDITFSKNDYVLNFLLNSLPKAIILHLPCKTYEHNDFITTLKLIFDDRIKICNDCSVCSIYKYFYIDKV